MTGQVPTDQSCWKNRGESVGGNI